MRRAPGNSDLTIQLIIWGGIAALVVVGFVIAQYLRRKRTEAFQRIAEDLGLAFTPFAGDAMANELGHFELFSKGHSKKISNLLHGTSNDRALAIFDYQFTTGSGKHAHTWHTTVMQIQFDGPELPRFSLCQESVWHKIGGLFGKNDIDFDTHPKFSRRHLLRGDDESAIREVFTPDILDYYEAHPGLNTEVCGNTLLFYRQGKKVKPHNVGPFLADGLALLPLFNRA